MYQEKYVKNTAQVHTGSVCTLIRWSEKVVEIFGGFNGISYLCAKKKE